jgi:hypothetical protein
LALAGILVVGLAAHLLLAPNIADLDSFYHLGHAAHYAETSLFNTAFPWARFSAVGDLGADLWWGFHLLLLPFTAFGEVADGIRVAGVILTTVLLAGVLWIALRHRFVAPWLWPVLFFVAAPNALYRYVMVRPHVLSLLAALLLVSFLVRGRWWQVLLASAALTWFHLSLSWLPLALVAAFAVARLFDRRLMAAAPRRADDDALLPVGVAIGSVLAGVAAGWLLRPHPIAAARLAEIQLFQLLREQATELPLAFSGELRPLPLAALGWSSWYLLLLWGGAVAVALKSAASKRSNLSDVPPPERALLWTSLLVSGGFLLLTVLVAQRALAEWAAFGVVAVALVGTYLVGDQVARRRTVTVLTVATLVISPWVFYWHRLNVRYNAAEPSYLGEVATWLADNSEPGDLVFHAHWDNFGPLFARNRINHYVGGMDPIFQYAHDPGLYWKYAYLSADLAAEWTCNEYPCRQGNAVDTYGSLLEDFDARWVLVEPERNAKLFYYFLSDARYEMGLLTDDEAVFRVLGSRDAADPRVAAGAFTHVCPSGPADSVPNAGLETTASVWPWEHQLIAEATHEVLRALDYRLVVLDLARGRFVTATSHRRTDDPLLADFSENAHPGIVISVAIDPAGDSSAVSIAALAVCDLSLPTGTRAEDAFEFVLAEEFAQALLREVRAVSSPR